MSAQKQIETERPLIRIDPENHESARVAERVGLQFERETRRPSGEVLRVSSMLARSSGEAVAG